MATFYVPFPGAFVRSLALFISIFLGLSLDVPAAQKFNVNTITRNKVSSFSESTLVVRAGEDVEIVLQNDSTDAKEYRNWVLVQPGAESTVMSSAMEAGAANKWTPTSSQVIVKSKLLAPGETDTLQFKAPANPGEYPYFCTFPGHFMSMRGKLIVKSANYVKPVALKPSLVAPTTSVSPIASPTSTP